MVVMEGNTSVHSLGKQKSFVNFRMKKTCVKLVARSLTLKKLSWLNALLVVPRFVSNVDRRTTNAVAVAEEGSEGLIKAIT